MRRYIAIPNGADGILKVEETATPTPESGELLVRVHAAGLNNGDIAQRRGMLDPRLPDTGPRPVGMEVSGVIEAVGSHVTGWSVGEALMGRCWGGYAEYAVVEASMAMRIPHGLSWAQAAAVPVTFVVSHDALVSNAELEQGSTVLINAASSGIGVASIQIARALGAGRIIGSSRSPEKFPALVEIGVDTCVDATDADFVEKVTAATDGSGVDIVIDSIGGPVLPKNLLCMAIKGRLVSVGRLGGTKGECDMDLMSLKRLRLIGVTNRTRTPEERAACAQRFMADMEEALASGRIIPPIDRVFPWEDAESAHSYLESGSHVGKVILSVVGDVTAVATGGLT